MKVLVLFGGDSPEREVSIWSGNAVREGLESAGFDVSVYDPLNGYEGLKQAVKKVDVVLPILHGIGGEDGSIQLVLEKLGVDYLGSNSKSSMVAFDKVKTHLLLESQGIRMPKYSIVSNTEDKMFENPFVLKPIKGGSSLDTLVARDINDELIDEANNILEQYDSMIVEELIGGQEITVPILGTETLGVMAVTPPANEEFNYDNKYNGNSKEFVLSDDKLVSFEKQKEAENIAIKVHKAVGARHLSRTDMFVSDDGTIYVLEINTMPGLSKQSFFPKAALYSGLDMAKLTVRFTELVKKG